MDENNQNKNEEMNQNVETTSQSTSQDKKLKNFSIASLVCGIVSIVTCCWWYISIPCGVVAIVLGNKSINEKYSKTGRTLGIIGVSLVVALILIGFILGASVMFGVFSALS